MKEGKAFQLIPLEPPSFVAGHSVANPDPGSGIRDPGSGIRDPVPFKPLDPDPGSGIGFSGSRIPNPSFGELSDKFLGKKFYISLKTSPNFLSSIFKKLNNF